MTQAQVRNTPSAASREMEHDCPPKPFSLCKFLLRSWLPPTGLVSRGKRRGQQAHNPHRSFQTAPLSCPNLFSSEIQAVLYGSPHWAHCPSHAGGSSPNIQATVHLPPSQSHVRAHSSCQLPPWPPSLGDRVAPVESHCARSSYLFLSLAVAVDHCWLKLQTRLTMPDTGCALYYQKLLAQTFPLFPSPILSA